VLAKRRGSTQFEIPGTGMLYTTLMRGMFRLAFGPTPDPPSARLATGLVLVADGIGGLDLCGTGLQVMAARVSRGLRVELVGWSHGFGRWFKDLTDTANVEAWAQRVAESVAAFRHDRPEAPVYLVGKSGGCGIIVHALERLPEAAVDAAVLISPAVSPGYDLSGALAAVRGETTVFWSPYDVILLGAGTRVFGTIDRVRTSAAGLKGFVVPPDLDAAGRVAYARLRQVRWRWPMAATGYLGGHVGADSPFFLERYVLPRLVTADGREMSGAGGAGSRPVAGEPIT
jgi:pimeloyl-ACP methyl ester carboxylesterase